MRPLARLRTKRCARQQCRAPEFQRTGTYVTGRPYSSRPPHDVRRAASSQVAPKKPAPRDRSGHEIGHLEVWLTTQSVKSRGPTQRVGPRTFHGRVKNPSYGNATRRSLE